MKMGRIKYRTKGALLQERDELHKDLNALVSNCEGLRAAYANDQPITNKAREAVINDVETAVTFIKSNLNKNEINLNNVSDNPTRSQLQSELTVYLQSKLQLQGLILAKKQIIESTYGGIYTLFTSVQNSSLYVELTKIVNPKEMAEATKESSITAYEGIAKELAPEQESEETTAQATI